MPPRKVNAEITVDATGEILKQIALKIDSIKTSRELNDTLARELKQLGSKVDDHDKSLMMIAKVMEDMNSNFHEFTETVKAIQKESREDQKQNQAIMMKMENVLTVISKYEPRFEKIESRQIEGCPSSLSARQALSSEMKHQASELDRLKVSNEKCREEIKVLQSDYSVHKEKISVSNNRTDDLEKYQEANEKWKTGLYTWLIAGTVTSMAGLLGIIYTNLK